MSRTTPSLASVIALAVALLVAPRSPAQAPAGGEFRVNTYTIGYQWSASAATAASGGFVLVWESAGQDGAGSGVFAQRYDAAGALRGQEFRVNASTTGSQFLPVVASGAKGDFVVAWNSGSPGSAVFARRFDASGVARGAELRVDGATPYGIYGHSVASDAAGNFVVVWADSGLDGWGWGVFGRRFDAAGSPRGAVFGVNSFTTGNQWQPAVAADPAGNFVVVWESGQPSDPTYGIAAQRYDASGTPQGAPFRVNTYTTGWQTSPAAALDPTGNLIVAWESEAQDGNDWGVFGQRFDASGLPLGTEFQVNTTTTGAQWSAGLAADASGAFVVTWDSSLQDGDDRGVFGQRFDASGGRRGLEFQVNSFTTSQQSGPCAGSDAVGNLVVAWQSWFQDGDGFGVFGQSFGGLQPAALSVDAAASSGSNGNRVLEPGETAVAVAPAWRNVNGAAQTFDGVGLSFSGPSASGVSYTLADAAGAYGTVANGSTAACSDCYAVGVGFGGTRPGTHWDATFTERLTPDALGQTKLWSLHLGDSFADVPRTSGFYPFVETLLHKGVTGGCSATAYCPANPVTREQVAVFTLAAKEGPGYSPPACTTPVFGDVPASSPFCRFVEELARRGVVGGCGGGNYCPSSPVTREQMPVFVLMTLDPALNPPPCGTPVFGDVPASSPFCRFIEELARRGVVGGCGNGNYCPTDAVTREQMAVFISVTFGFSLYGP